MGLVFTWRMDAHTSYKWQTSDYVILRNVIARGEFKGQQSTLILTLGLVNESSSPTVGTRDTETKLAACLVNVRGVLKRSNLEERERRPSVVMALYQLQHTNILTAWDVRGIGRPAVFSLSCTS